MKTRFLGAAYCCAFNLAVSISANAASISGQGTWETTLHGRDLDGNLSTAEAYYDTVLNITWLADANYVKTSGYDADGGMTWSSSNIWAANLNINGYTGWRLSTVTDTGTSGCDLAYVGTDCGWNVDTATGEMAHMFYVTLGNTAYFDTVGNGPQAGWGLSNTGPFSISIGFTNGYWSGTEYAPDTNRAWQLSFDAGGQAAPSKLNDLNAWAVHSGDVGVAVTTSAVPVPAAVWLFGSGLLGLIGMARRKAA